MITDLRMPDMDGIELLRAARILRPEVHRVLVTAFGTIESTVEAMKLGAFDVLAKPLKMQALKNLLATLVNPKASSATVATAHVSDQHQKVLDRVSKAAESQAHVLFTGESGTGKSHLARLLHQHSPRAQGPFVVINCAAIPSDLLESELFGVEKGAYTGAHVSRPGHIGAAHHGSLLLDEIGDMSLGLQAKILQLIQDKSYFRLGSNKSMQADLRIIAATHQDLKSAVDTHRFRQDLYYRLKVVEIHIPPLRERITDLLWLVPQILDSLSEKNSKPKMRLSDESLKILLSYSWPGNIRELENVLESMLVMASIESLQSGCFEVEALPDFLRSTAPTQSPLSVKDLASLTQEAIQRAMIASGGNRKLAAAMLGISERTLYRNSENSKQP